MYNRLYEYLTKINLMFYKQFGFRKDHSTKHALSKLVNRIYDSFNENKYTFDVVSVWFKLLFFEVLILMVGTKVIVVW